MDNAKVEIPLTPYQMEVQRTENIGNYDLVKQRLANLGTVRMLHGIIGSLTELGELADILKRHLFYGAEIDTRHVMEELGDGRWYAATTANAFHFNESQVEAGNVAKLHKRYPKTEGDFRPEVARAPRNTEAELGAMVAGSGSEDIGVVRAVSLGSGAMKVTPDPRTSQAWKPIEQDAPRRAEETTGHYAGNPDTMVTLDVAKASKNPAMLHGAITLLVKASQLVRVLSTHNVGGAEPITKSAEWRELQHVLGLGPAPMSAPTPMMLQNVATGVTSSWDERTRTWRERPAPTPPAPPLPAANTVVPTATEHTMKAFSSGARSSVVKPRLDLVPPIAVELIAERFTYGVASHGERNYKKGEHDPVFLRDRLNHLLAHTMEYAQTGRRTDLSAILCNAAMLAELGVMTDDRTEEYLARLDVGKTRFDPPTP